MALFFKICRIIFACQIAILPISLGAVPINGDVALVPHKDGAVVRQQVIVNQSHLRNKEVSAITVPFAYVPAITERLSLLFVVPYRFVRKATSPEIGSFELQSETKESGFVDGRLLAKYIFFKHDWSGGTLRWALPAGITVPTREKGFSANSYSGIIGQVITLQTLDMEADFDITFQAFDVRHGIKPGNIIKYNAALGFRILPWTLPEEGVPSFLNLVFELNGEFQENTIKHRAADENTGGRILFFSTGLQFAHRRFILEASYQKPVSQKWNGNTRTAIKQFTIEERYRIGVRVLF